MSVFILYSFVLLGAFKMVQPYRILAEFHFGGHSSYGGAASDSFYSSVNGFQDHRETHVTYAQHPDGSCFKKVVQIDNGQQSVEEIPLSCEQARKEIREEHKKEARKMKEESRRINDEVKKSFKESFDIQKRIQDDINRSFRY